MTHDTNKTSDNNESRLEAIIHRYQESRSQPLGQRLEMLEQLVLKEFNTTIEWRPESTPQQRTNRLENLVFKELDELHGILHQTVVDKKKVDDWEFRRAVDRAKMSEDEIIDWGRRGGERYNALRYSANQINSTSSKRFFVQFRSDPSVQWKNLGSSYPTFEDAYRTMLRYQEQQLERTHDVHNNPQLLKQNQIMAESGNYAARRILQGDIEYRVY